MSPDFAARWFEIDPTWQVMKLLARAGVIDIAAGQRARYPRPRAPQLDDQRASSPCARWCSTSSMPAPSFAMAVS